MRSRSLLLTSLLFIACGKDKNSDDTGSNESGDDTETTSSTRIDGIFNEFLSSNDTTNTDESDEYDDWLELANPNDEPLDLSGYGLTDGLDNGEETWTIPNGTVILPGRFLLIWCDEDEDQGSFHASFKLKAAGETISLVDAAGELVDEVEVPSLPIDTSWARTLNGQWTEAAPSPEFQNN